MSTKRAVVENGRISVEVDFPDGTELDVFVDPQVDPFASMTPDERALLDASIARGLAEAEAGKGRPAAQVIAALRSRR